MKIVKLLCLIAVEVFLVGLLVAPHTQRHPQSQLHAFSAWCRNPTPETYSQWQKENRKIQREDMLVQILLLCAIGLTTMGIVKCGRKMKNRPNKVVVSSSDGSAAPAIPRDDSQTLA